MANDINLPNLVSHLEVQLADTNGIIADAARQGSSVGAALGESLRTRVAEAVAHIPPVEIDGDPSPLDGDLTRVRGELTELANTRIGVDISIEEALRRFDQLEPHLDRLERSHPSIAVQAAIGGARADLQEILEEARRVDDDDVDIDVHVDTSHSTSSLHDLEHSGVELEIALDKIGPAAASLGKISALAGAGIPAVAGLVATLAEIAPVALVGVGAILAVASAAGAVKIGTSGIGDALDAAFAPVSGGGGGGGGGSAGAAAAATNAVADAQRNLKDTIQQAAQSNVQAIRSVASAQRDLTDAQKAAADAQRDLLGAEKEASRQLEDQNNQLIDAKNDERDADFAVKDAQAALDATKAKGSKASLEDQQKAQLALDKAKQQLAEQSLAVQRLQADTDTANKAGVAGSQTVVDAQQKISDTSRDVADRQRDVSDAQQEVARTAASGAESIDKAREALEQAGQAANGGGAGGGGAAGGVDAFAAAMAKLSPSAQAFVREIIKLKPAFDSLQLDVQEHLLAGLAAELDTTATSLLPVFRRGLDDSADSLNAMAKGVLAAAGGLAADGTLGTALAGANRGLANLVPIPGQFVSGLGKIGAAAGPAFDRVTDAVARVAKSVSDKLNSAFASGQLERSIDLAVGLIGEILGVVGSLITILTNVFAPAVASGENFIGVIQDIVGQLVKATGARGFQDALAALFGVIGEIGKVAGPLLLIALQDLEPVFTALGGPATDLVDALGAGLQPILLALAPLLITAATAVGDLVEAALPLLPVVSDVVTSLGPDLQPILNDLVLLFVRLAPVVQDVADTLSVSLQPLLDALPALIGPIADLITRNLVVALIALAAILEQNAPELAQLAIDLANLALALGPLITLFTVLTTKVLILLTPVLLQILAAATRFGTYLAGTFSGVISNLVIPALRTLADLLHGRVGDAWDEVRTHAAAAVGSVLRLLTGLPGAAAAALVPLASKIGSKASDAANRLTAPIGDGVNTAIEFVGSLPGRALAQLGDLAKYLYNSGRSLIGGFISGMLSKLSDAKDAAGNLLGSIKDYFPNSPAKVGPFSGPGWTHFSGQAVVDDWGAGMLASLPGLLATIGQVVGGASGALAGLPSLAGAVPSAGALAASYAGSAAPMAGPTTINMYGTEATPAGVSDALSWRSKVGRH